MSSAVVLPITRRFVTLSILGSLGAVLFVPSMLASASPRPSILQILVFVITVSVIGAISTWFGLRCADAAALPMPYLRRLDHGGETHSGNGLLVAGVFGLIFAVVTIVMLRTLRLPNLAGPLWSRIVSVVFAAGSLELVVHLLIMSMVVRVTRGKVWAGVSVSALFFVLFHASGLFGQSSTVILSALLMNGIFALGLGAIYARYGFEYLLLCHGVGHVLAVSIS